MGNARKGRKARTVKKIHLDMSWWLVRCVVREGKGNTNTSGVQSLGNWVDVGAILFNR